MCFYFTAYLECTPCSGMNMGLTESSVISAIGFHSNNTFPVFPSTH